MTFWHLIIISGVFQGLFLAGFLLVHRRSARRANRFLGWLLITYSVSVGLSMLYVTGYPGPLVHLAGLESVLYFLFGPLLYLYAKSLISHRRIPRWTVVAHLLPTLGVALYYLPYFLLNGTEKATWLAADVGGDEVTGAVAYFAVYYAYTLVYHLWVIGIIQRHNREIADLFSELTSLNLSWLRNLTLLSAAVIFLEIVVLVLWGVDALSYGLAYALGYLPSALLIYSIGYFALKQPALFEVALPDPQMLQADGAARPAPAEDEPHERASKYATSSLTDGKAETLRTQLLALMEEAHLYRTPNLRLADVAAQLDAAPNHVSQVINERMGKNFFDLVNHYRIEEAKAILVAAEQQHLTIQAVAFEVGFNAKTTFNVAFKKHTGLTPTQFKRTAATSRTP